MALRTDIKKALHNNTELKVKSVKPLGEPKITLNKRWKVYTIKFYVKI